MQDHWILVSFKYSIIVKAISVKLIIHQDFTIRTRNYCFHVSLYSQSKRETLSSDEHTSRLCAFEKLCQSGTGVMLTIIIWSHPVTIFEVTNDMTMSHILHGSVHNLHFEEESGIGQIWKYNYTYTYLQIHILVLKTFFLFSHSVTKLEVTNDTTVMSHISHGSVHNLNFEEESGFGQIWRYNYTYTYI